MVYVTPTPTMMVRAGQHVSGEGRVYHPYLAGWGDFWDVSGPFVPWNVKPSFARLFLTDCRCRNQIYWIF